MHVKNIYKKMLSLKTLYPSKTLDLLKIERCEGRSGTTGKSTLQKDSPFLCISKPFSVKRTTITITVTDASCRMMRCDTSLCVSTTNCE